MERDHGERGQTSIDFLTGMSIFALTIIFVLQFTSGSLVSVATTTPEKNAMADRTAAVLYSDRLTTSNHGTGMVDEGASRDYFSTAPPVTSYSDMRDDLAIPEKYGFNITVTDTSGNLISDAGTGFSTEFPGGDVEGTVPSDDSSITVASKTRVAYMDRNSPDANETVLIRVRVW